MNDEPCDVYKAAVEEFGKKAQVLKLVEECGELITACMHMLSCRPDAILNLVEEIADVEIMCTQMRTIVGDAGVDAAKKYKLDRLRGMIDARMGGGRAEG